MIKTKKKHLRSLDQVCESFLIDSDPIKPKIRFLLRILRFLRPNGHFRKMKRRDWNAKRRRKIETILSLIPRIGCLGNGGFFSWKRFTRTSRSYLRDQIRFQIWGAITMETGYSRRSLPDIIVNGWDNIKTVASLTGQVNERGLWLEEKIGPIVTGTK